MTSLAPFPLTDRRPAAGSLIPAILCGGSGSRLWPVSRRNLAKQHVPMLGGASPFQRTLGRIAGELFAAPIVVSAAASRFLVAEQAAAAGAAIELALEPEGRDTLAAVTLAACLAARRDPSATVLVMPSDHLIPDVEAFARAAAAAARLASDGRIVVLGVTPTEPSTGYGYIARGATLDAGGNSVARFVEKPDAASAARLIVEGCLWNAGMFCFRADAGLLEIERHAPQTLEAVRWAIRDGHADLGALELSPAFLSAPKVSFDYAVMERTANAAVLEAGFPWTDIGDWKTVWEQSPRDADGNAREGRVHTRDVSDSYLRADGRLVCVLGVRGLAVIDTPDALLIAPIDRAQEVKRLVAELEADGAPEAHTPARVYKPWGWYQTIDRGPRFRVKRIMVMPGKKLSLQRHHHRSEHWIVVKGTAEVTIGENVQMLRENESVYIPLGEIHRLANPGKIMLELIEVQTGSYLGEDDIIRIVDEFGRS